MNAAVVESHSPEVSRSSWWVLAAMVVIGSTTATAAKFAVADLPVSLVPIVRFGGAGLALLPFVLERGVIWRMIRDDWQWLLLASVLCVPVNQAFFLNGTRLSPTTHVGLIYATCPVIVLLLAVLMRQERIQPARAVGIVASVAGAAVIALGNLKGKGGAGGTAGMGDLLLVGAVLAWGGYLTVNKRLLVDYPAFAVLSATFLLGSLLCVPTALMNSGDWPRQFAAARPQAWWGLIYLTLVASLTGLALQNVALRRFQASHVAAVGNLSPALTVLWGILLLGEELTPFLVIGGILTVGGIVWASRKRPAVVSGATSRVLSGVSACPRVSCQSPREHGA